MGRYGRSKPRARPYVKGSDSKHTACGPISATRGKVSRSNDDEHERKKRLIKKATATRSRKSSKAARPQKARKKKANKIQPKGGSKKTQAKKHAKKGGSKKTQAKKHAKKGGSKKTQAKKHAKKGGSKKTQAKKHAKKGGSKKTHAKKPKRLPTIKKAQSKLDRLEQKRQKIKDERRTHRTAANLRAYRKVLKEQEAERKKAKDRVLKELGAPVKKGSPKSKQAMTAHLEILKSRWEDLYQKASSQGQLPEPGELVRRMGSHRVADGLQVTIPIEDFITPESVEEFLYQVRQAKKDMPGMPCWLATLVMSTLGEQITGYAQRLLFVDDPHASEFQVELVDSTGVFMSFEGMMDSLEDLLTTLADEQFTLVYLNFIRFMNFAAKGDR